MQQTIEEIQPIVHIEKGSMMRILVLGLGNESYGDDGVGIHVVRRARTSIQTDLALYEKDCSISFEECSLSGLALLDVIAGYDALVIIDTIKSPHPESGKIRVLNEKDLRHIPGPSPHYVSIPQAIEIGRRIDLKVPSQIAVIAVEAKNMYNFGESLTREMENAVPKIIAELKDLISQIQEKERQKRGKL